MVGMEKQFTTRQVLTVSTGYLLCNGIGEVYEILNHLTGCSLYTHQLPSAAERVNPELVKYLPWIIGATISGEDVKDPIKREFWLSNVEAEYGTHQMLPQVVPETDTKDSVQELIDMVGHERVVVVGVEGATP